MIKKTSLCLILLSAIMLNALACSSSNQYVLDERSFFLVMTNMQYYPEQYENATIEYDCFTYTLTDVNGNTYTCGVRKCSSGYGCTCSNDTIIGFILDSPEQLPPPKNQSADTNDKMWIHLKGTIKSSKKVDVTIYSYKNGEPDLNNTETLSLLVFSVESYFTIDDYSKLNYYVTK